MALTKIVDTVQSGLNTFQDSRRAFTLSNGNVLMLCQESLTVIRVYETSDITRKTGWTLRGTISAPDGVTGAAGSTVLGVTGDLFVNNDLGIAVILINGGNYKVVYYKFTYSGYTMGTIESVFTALTSTYSLRGASSVDISVSEFGAVHMALIYSIGLMQPRLRTMVRTTANTWVWTNSGIDIDLGTTGNQPGDYLATIVSLGGVTTAKRLVVATSVSFFLASTFGYSDTGTVVWSATTNEASGAQVAALTQRLNTNMAASNYPQASWGGKTIKAFRSTLGADLFFLGIMCGTSYILNGDGASTSVSGGSNRGAVVKGIWDGTTYTTTNQLSKVYANPNAQLGVVGASNRCSLGITFFDGGTTDEQSMAFNFVGAFNASGTIYTRIGVMHALFSPQTNGNVSMHQGAWVDGANDGTVSVFSGGNRNLTLTTVRHDTLVFKSDLKPYSWQAPTPPAPTAVTPDNGQNITTATPDLTVSAQYVDQYWAPAMYTAEWQIAPDATFTTGLRTYNDTEIFTNADKFDKTTGQSVGGFYNFDGSTATPKQILIQTALGYTPLAAGTWYIRARLHGGDGMYSAYTTATRIFTIGHPPTAVPTSPLNNQMFDYTGGGGNKTFSWDFSDPSSTDSQTAYQLRIRTADAAGTIIYDSGKITTTVRSVTVAIPSGNKNMTLYWEVKLWDTDNAGGLYSAGNTYFQMIDPATAAVTAPTLNQVLSVGTTTLNATVAATGGRVVKAYTYRVIQAGTAIWTSTPVQGTFSNGNALPYIMPAGVLKNNQAYSVQVTVTDDAGVTSTSNPVTFTTAWTAALGPGTITAAATSYNVDGAGYVRVSWVDANKETGFLAWNVYRRIDLIDPNTQAVLSVGTYQLVYTDYRALSSGTYTWDDYLAPAGQKLNYLVTQVADRGGFTVESENITAGTVFPATDGYWLLDNTNPLAPLSMKLALAKADDYTEEQEESEYIVIGRGRHVDKGEFLGPKGSLTLQVRDTTGGTSARQKRLALLDYQKRLSPLYLRNPFGDVMKVNISAMSVSRIAGVGSSEFCDVTIPYSQVG